MTDLSKGKEFGGALEQLRRAARINLPRLSHEYEEVTRRLSATGYGEDADFSLPPYFQENGPHGTFYPAWAALRDELLNATSVTTNNYQLVAEALDIALKAFMDEDDTAADEVDRIRGEFESSGSPHTEEFDPSGALPPESSPERT